MIKKVEKQKIKLCFVSLNAYQFFMNKEYAGGAEAQQIELAKELHKRGYKISFITYGEKHTGRQIIDGIELIPTYSRSKTNTINLLKKLRCIWRKMKEVDADVYFYQAGSPGIVTFFARLCRKKVIILLASNADVTREIIIYKDSPMGYIYKIGRWLDIKLSTIVIAQNTFQQSKLQKRFKVPNMIIKNAYDLSSSQSIATNGEYILWVAIIRSVKQPFLFLKIAEHFPQHKFIMIGGEGENPDLFRSVKTAADKIPNLRFTGFVPHKKIFSYYTKAIVLVNTSLIEGFPNVFIEAWLHAIPVVSLNVDPDRIISKFHLGFCSNNFNQMINDLGKLLENKTLRKTMGENGRNYVEKYHDVREVADRYENLIKNLIEHHMRVTG